MEGRTEKGEWEKGMKKEAFWLQNKKNIILYLRMHRIKIKCVFKRVMMKRHGIAGPGIAISFLMKKMIKEYDSHGNVIVVERDAPTSRIVGKTKQKAMALLELTQDSSVSDCEKINNEINK